MTALSDNEHPRRRRRTPTEGRHRADGRNRAVPDLPGARRPEHRRRVRGRAPRPATVWPCASSPTHPAAAGDLGRLAPWLLTATAKIVTTYTTPGQRVLLVGAVDPLDPTGPAHLGIPRPARTSPLSGLTEAAWTVLRLGRGTRTHLTGPGAIDPATRPETSTRHSTTNSHRAPAGDGPSESESGPGLRVTDLLRTSGRSPAWTADESRTEPAGGPTGGSVDRYDLIIITVPPGATDWLRPADWAPVLTPTGTLAVVTHSHRQGGRLVGPAATVIPQTTEAGLLLLDRIVLLTTTPRRAPARRGHRPGTLDPAGPADTTEYVDLLLFATTDSGEAR
ncbi:hypothetical protein [Actinokineospora cianjurensis]|uniref:Uncharacterized protein n=1 Tax=Actinokineospora cianjurensis TaxID=585224 RepID=A0A421BC75_9PSEU|nr:hypothetical protein [Actinokineospora cianjurensis]RLK61943.1 hypothetical protein CLV68_2488 [Actinokineospora cianjurensis]